MHSCISLYGLTTSLFIGFTIGKTLNTWCQKMVTYPCRSLATNAANIRIMLQLTPTRITSQLPINLDLVFSQSPHAHLSTSCWFTSSIFCRCLYHVELPRPSTLLGRFTSTFDLFSIHLDFSHQSIHLD
jgi:hypothetical protein